jgi:hypothetical protein
MMVRYVDFAVNVPATWQHLAPQQNDFEARIFGGINDMLAAITRRDYEPTPVVTGAGHLQGQDEDSQAMFKLGKDGKPRQPMRNRRHDNTLVFQ